MRYAGLLAGIWLVLAISCRGDETFAKVRGGSVTGYIIPKVIADGWMRTYNDPQWTDDGKCWMPTNAEAVAAEKAVRDVITRAQKDVKAAFPNDPESALSLDRRQLAEIDKQYSRYGIQFIGVLVHGKKEIFCNYFCRDATKQLDPAHDFIFLYDGGSCFWRVEYIPETKSCAGLQINSEG